MQDGEQGQLALLVAPFVGAWIEIALYPESEVEEWVAPFVGAWIEIGVKIPLYKFQVVAPFVGAWIEITRSSETREMTGGSLPLWERGLK